MGKLDRRSGYSRYETKSLEMQYNEGYTLLDKLKNDSLVIKGGGQWRIHPLLRGMAINIAKATEEIIAKSDMNCIEIPENSEWHENLQKVFLRGTGIQKIVDGTSPKCSKLSTLLLDNNDYLEWIPDNFFNNMPALKVLDLSRTSIKRLPESVSNLKCLITLLLRCKKLSYMPSLEKLQRLMWLDLSNTAIIESPYGLELLINLRYLNLAGTVQLKMSSSVITNMTDLQSLRLNCIPKSMDGSAHVLQCLGKLEYMTANFYDIEEFNSDVQSLQVKDRALKELYLPEDIKELMITHAHHHWTGTTCLCQTLSFPKLVKIEYLRMHECDKLENLCCGSPTCPFWCSVQFMQTLRLTCLKDLKQIAASFAPFSHLRKLKMHHCGSMRILMMWIICTQLQNLEAIHVSGCDSMEEIVGDDCSGETIPPTTITLPKLRLVVLEQLPKLKSVFRGTLLCPSLKSFRAIYCEKLISQPLIEIAKGNALQMEKKELLNGYGWQK
ncbi:probable disease resistance protein At4g27220, partial [Prosopis cineraria]|uniref:probable disease resistance protein At4g27220 n=1 Tax=Prosopis cineraria TaxID=364024 RepID=UPI00240F6455